MIRCPNLVIGLLVAGFLGCGGGSPSGSTPTPAPQLASRMSYTDPTGSGWRFIKQGGSGTSADPLVLELRGPAALRVKGLAFFLELAAGTPASWTALGGSSCVLPTSNLDLGSDPRFLKDRLTGNELQVGIFQKAGELDPSLGVLRVGLSLKANATVGELALLQHATKAAVLNGDGSVTTPVAIQVGVIRAE